MKKTVFAFVPALPAFISALFFITSDGRGNDEGKGSVQGIISQHCTEMIGPPRVEKISENVWAAIGCDLATTVLVHTKDGNLIIDPAMSPGRGREIKKLFDVHAPAGPVKAIIYTHSHIDHIGGASVWADKNTPIWATDAFKEHLFKQYGLFAQIETIRGRRQFGDNVPLDVLPCNGIGRRADVKAALESGVLLPTDTFSGKKTITVGGIELEMVEAHGETHDQLFVWIPADRTLVAADNFYHSFPNLYTIRGTSPRPIDAWIRSLDEMRRKDAEHMVPCHTKPLHGKKEIADALTDYRDAIQWVRDAVVRGANEGRDVDTLAETIKLPEHLAKKHHAMEFYGEVSWSVRAIYANNLGWFDGRPDMLYPPDAKETAKREVELMGGAERVIGQADDAVKKKDYRWAIHLLAKVKRSGLVGGKELDERLALAYEGLAGELYNLNGRGYLYESALELRKGVPKYPAPKYSEEVVTRIPLELIFTQMEVRLKPDRAMDVHECVHFVFPDEDKKFIVTVRNGVCEAVTGEPLPGTPEPVAVITADAATWRKLAVKLTSPAAALASGKIKVNGSWTGFIAFMKRFQM